MKSLLACFTFFLASYGFAQSPGQTINYDEAVAKQREYIKGMIQELEEAKAEMEKAQTQVDQMREIISAVDGPALQAVIRVVQDKDVQETAKEVFDKEKWKYFSIAQICGVLFMMFFRAWATGRAKTFLQKLWTSFYCTAIYFGVAFYVIPVLVFGQGYRKLLVEIYQVI